MGIECRDVQAQTRDAALFFQMRRWNPFPSTRIINSIATNEILFQGIQTHICHGECCGLPEACANSSHYPAWLASAISVTELSVSLFVNYFYWRILFPGIIQGIWKQNISLACQTGFWYSPECFVICILPPKCLSWEV